MAEPIPRSAEKTVDWLRRLLARHAALDPAALDPDERLNRYGLSSLTAAAVAAQIADRVGRKLPPTLIWDHPTLRRLAAFLDSADDPDDRAPPAPLAADDAIAIVGLSCRLPGAASPAAFWQMLCGGTDAIAEVPAERWPSAVFYDPDPQAPGRMATRWGGFIDAVDQFDAEFFGMSPREAAQADPQQRLALELAWEALEDAAIRPRRLGGSRTGVFIGAMWSDYARLLGDRDAIAAHTATGQDTSIISARIAYALGLEGPALTVNTACSSALVAVHQACRSLRAGESTLTLAGGVHLLLAPESGIAMTKFGAMAPDGRCKAFDARADGYVRGEGGGIVVLKPLSAAHADGNRIYAVIGGGAVNNDGASNGLTAPNPAAQRAMLRDALGDAGVAAARIDYVEAHGTGTALGDPIEANALSSVLCTDRPADRPLRIGSVKANIGHLEAAAGAAGLIKLALALHHRWIPPSLHFETPNPAIDFAAARLVVPTRGEAWPAGDEPAVGGVSSFGFGGTNCHLLLEAAPAPPPKTFGEHRPVFVFAGNGGNWPGMAAALLANADFARSLRRSEMILGELGYPAAVTEVLADGRVEDVALGQPALCAFQLALADLLAGIGIRPAAVIGHSVGEAAAAAVAGILRREDALRLVVVRSRLQAQLAGEGAMALAAAAAETIAPHLPEGVVIAGENGPRATLLAGTPAAIATACRSLDAAGIVSQRIAVPVAYHSPQMDALRPLLEAELADLAPNQGSVPMVSTVTGAAVDGAALDAAYWGRNLRDRVRFRDAVAALAEAGHREFLEIAPHPLLAAQIGQTAPGALVVSPLRRGAADIGALRAALSPLATEEAAASPHLLVLSARSPAALAAMEKAWAGRLPADWADLCHTALVGRERFHWRLALVAADGEEARRKLLAGEVLGGRGDPEGVAGFDPHPGPGESRQAYLERCAAAFVAGADLDAAMIEAGAVHRIVAAPTYPFERRRHWLPTPSEGLSYALEWVPLALPSADAGPLAVPTPAAAPADAGLDVEAGEFARAALASVPDAAIVPQHRAFAARLAEWPPVTGPAAKDGPAAQLLRRVGAALPDILAGRRDALDVLFPGGRVDALAEVYDAPPFAAAQDALAAALAALDRPLRVLELGAGTGSLTRRLLAALPPGSELTASDVSPAFLAALRQRFATLQTLPFDIDRPEAADGPYDAIVAANVVHAGSDVAAILAALRARLAPGGVLGLVELVRVPRWIDLVFGITGGWWRFRGDPRRPTHAVLAAAAWHEVLEEAGFVAIGLGEDGDAHAVITARAPPAAARVYRSRASDPALAVAELQQAVAADGAAGLSVVLGGGLADAAVAGAARAVALEQPQRIAATIELMDDSAASQTKLQEALGRTGGEDQLRIAAGALAAARLVPISTQARLPMFAGDRLYLIAGGLGRLGQACASFMVDRGARQLLLLGRSPGDAGRLAALRRLGVTTHYRQLDLASADAAERLSAAIAETLGGGRLGGVVHAAGVVDGATAAIIAAKLDVAAALEAATRRYEPEFLLLFSSAAGIWGRRGHAAYAAANRALDRWAEMARARGLPATAVAFGRFAEPGLLAATEDAALAASGLLAMPSEAGFAAAFQTVADGVAHRIVAAVDWPRFRASFEARRRRPLFDLVAPAPAAPPPVPSAIAAAPKSLDRAGVAALVAEAMGHDDPARIDPERGLFEQGLDSLMAVGLRRRLEAAAGIPVPASALFAHPTLSRLAAWLAGQAPQTPPRRETAYSEKADQKIAIIGLACRLPGGITGPQELLALLASGRDAIAEFPADRPTAALWQAAADRVASRRGGFLDGVDLFDAGFFGISPREAAQLDPQQRLLLEVAWEALEDAGLAADTLAGSRTGVYVGATGSDYAALARRAGAATLDAHSLIGQPSNTLAGRIAYQFGLHGPALTVDTACSSSLVALHLAVGALRRGEAEQALVAGVNLILTPETSVMLSQAGVLSPTGECRAFDAAADGYVRGEAVGVAVLKPLDAARRDGDRILAALSGSAVNHDGRSSSFTAPNGAAQAAVIRDALADAGLGPDDIDYVEAHGTGTALGDPVELDALAEVFAGRGRDLPVGSVKAALGHAEAAAGITGVIKAVLCLGGRSLPPQANFAHRNPLARADAPIAIAGAASLPPERLRHIGVSAFGASGTNAHAILEAVEDLTAARSESRPPPTRFARQRYWLDDIVPQAAAHVMLGAPRRSARSGEEVREGRLDAALPWLRDHVVDGATLLPAAGFLALAGQAGMATLADVEFRRPLELAGRGTAIQLVRDRDDVVALYAETPEGWSEIAAGRASGGDGVVPFAERPAAGAEMLDAADFAAELAARGFAFGPAYRVVQRLRRDGTAAEAEIAAPGPHDAQDPTLLDAALQSLTSLLPHGEAPWLPARIGHALLRPLPSGQLTARARLRTLSGERAIGDALLEDAAGAPLVVLRDVELRPLPAAPAALMHDVVWRPATSEGAPPAGCWHAIGPGAAALGLASCDEDGTAALPSQVDGVVDLRPLAAPTPQACIAATADLVRRAAAMTPPPQLVLVSRGASPAPPVLPGAVPAAAVLMGLQPAIAAEHPELRCRWLDLDQDDPDLPAALAGASGRYALRQGRLLMPEIVKALQEPPGLLRLAPGPERSFADLAVLPDVETPPGPGEVRLAVAAVGLNFKDALAALGRAPGPETAGAALGLECAGEVIAVGAGVTGFAPGDAVLAFAPGALASRVNVSAACVLHRPQWLDADTAASLPVAALTAWHGLCDIAAVGPGMRVLVHAGAGGVGAMAVGLARALGASVFATASAGKERAARAAGAEMVGNSRSLDFVETAREWAGPAGFDVVLNALGPAIASASAALLRPGGVFLEIGNAPPPAAAQPVRHVAYDLSRPLADPGWFRDRLQRVLDMLCDGRLPPPRRAVVPLARAGEALRALGDGATIGKLVVRVPQALRLRPDGSYLVTGGTGTVGRALARWLKAGGAGEVVLAARHASPDAEFRTVAVDVSNRLALAELLAQLPRLAGVIHAAGVVQDRTLANLGEADIAAATAAKLVGAVHLDALTRDRRLDFFVLISSTAGSLAAPGQAAYAAANAWLDRLAAARRAVGLPATAIGFGPWQGGMFARLDAAARRMIEKSGLRPMPPRRAVAAFACVLESGAVHRLVMERTAAQAADRPMPAATAAAVLAAPPGERAALLREALAGRLVALLGLPAETRLDPRRALRDLGLDSLLSISLRNELAAEFGLDLPSTLLFDHPTLEALAAFLLSQLTGAEAPLADLDEGELAALLERELDTAS